MIEYGLYCLAAFFVTCSIYGFWGGLTSDPNITYEDFVTKNRKTSENVDVVTGALLVCAILLIYHGCFIWVYLKFQ